MPEDFFRDIHNKGILIVAAAGNNGHTDDSDLMMMPAGFPQSTISVGSVNLSKKRHHTSAINSQVEFCAMGTNVVSTGFKLDGEHYEYDYIEKTGTSMAAPQVAAVAGLLWSHFPRCSSLQVREVLARTAMPHLSSHNHCDEYCGFGIVQLQDAYDLLRKSGTGGNYDCSVGGPILSSTNNVCDCINSNFSPSKCLYSTPEDHKQDSRQGPSDRTVTPSFKSDQPKCRDNDSAKFKLVRPSRNLRRGRGRKRKITRQCSYVRKRKDSLIAEYCKTSTAVRESCRRTCAFIGVSYDGCTF